MLKKILKVALAILTVLLLVAVFVTWRNYSQLKNAVADLQAKDYPTQLADLKRDVPSSDNAAAYLAAVAKDAESLYTRIHPYAHADTDHFDWRAGLNESQIAETAAGWDAYPQVLEAMSKASDCRNFVWPMNLDQPTDQFVANDLMDVANSVRTFARLYDCRARYLISIKKPDEAAEVYLQLLRLSRLQDHQPTIVLYLVTNACRAIGLNYLGQLEQHHPLSSSTYERIEAELALHQEMAGFVPALKGEIPVALGMFRTFPFPGKLTMRMDHHLQYLQEQIEIGVEDHYLYGKRKRPATKGFVELLAPAVDASREMTSRMRATVKCLRILNAIHALGIKPGLKVDASQLRLADDVMRDPFSGQPLIVRSTAEGWSVYSVGTNGKDDGGKVEDVQDVGFASPQIAP